MDTEESAKGSSAVLDTQAVDKKLEESSSAAKDTPSTSAIETPAEPAPTVQETPTKPEAAVEATPDSDITAQEVAEEEISKADVPKEPSPTPAPVRAPAPEPEKPKGPPKPMTWASRIAAAAGPAAPVKPVVPLPAKAAAPPAQPRTAAAPAATPASAPAQATEAPAQSANKDSSEWRTAGADTKKQSRQQSIATPTEKEGTLAYVKFVTEKVKEDDLKSALTAHGDLVYFDINRAKVSYSHDSVTCRETSADERQNCAFVEFGTVSSCQAAIKASPITISGESIAIEPRRPKAGAYGGANYNNRGSVSGRGRGGFEGGNRSGSQSGGRGGYNTPRGRGGAPRGRGGAQQAANA